MHRDEEARKAVEAISEENIVPYKIALADLPPVFPEQILKEETVIERYEEEKTVVESLSAEDEARQEEEKLAEEKPVDANSEIVPNKNLTDDEIAQLILEEEELLSDKGLLGVNFKKLRPRVPILKDSKVLEELQHIATAEPERTQELKRTSTFLQKPQRPIPKAKCEQKIEEDDGESYKVVIKKQDRKTVIARLVEKGLLPPGSEASIARTPEPLETSEVKMHETKNRLEEDRPPVMSDLNPPCSISSLDTIDESLLPSRSPQLDSNETRPFEDQLGCPATYKCKSKLFDIKPNRYRRFSSFEGYNEGGMRSPFKGHYLENILCSYANSCVSRDRQIDDEFEFAKMKSGSFCFKKYWPGNVGFDCPANETMSRRRLSRCPRAHYAERILLRNVSPITRHFHSKPKTTRIVASRMKRIRTKGRYLAMYFRRESTRLVSLITTLFQFLLQRSSVLESSNVPKIRNRRLSCRGRYVKHLLEKNVTTVLQRVEKMHSIDDYPSVIKNTKDEPKSTRTKGRYLEKYLHRQTPYIKSALAYLLGSAKSSFDNLFSVTSSSRIKSAMRGRYFERFVRRNLEILELFTEYVCIKISEWLEENPSCISQNEFSVMTSNYIADDSILEEKIDEDTCGIKVSRWHEDGPSCSLQEESNLVIVNPEPNKETECNDNSILPEEVELSVSSKIPEEEDAFSNFLQSTENYISTEVFHRGSRRFSRSRKSVDIIPDDNTLSQFLESAENYVSAEVFHRRSRRLSRSSKDRETGVLSSLCHSTGDYVSSEVFHRGSRRLSKSSRRESLTPDSESMYFNLPWFSFKVTDKSVERRDNYKEKIDEIERDNRRLSFVPTVLYQSITNRIGIDFTRLVAYGFVPCTSIILLYMYK